METRVHVKVILLSSARKKGEAITHLQGLLSQSSTHRNGLSHSPGDQKSKIKVCSGMVPSEDCEGSLLTPMSPSP